MSIQKIPKNPSRFPPNPELEEKVENFLKDTKKAFTTNEVAEQTGDDFHAVRKALYNLRNDGKIHIITFETNEINWIHKDHLKR